MDAAFALRFAEEWEAAWNAHDLERILSHYTDDVVFLSPHIIERFGEPSGELHGKAALRAYWGAGLQRETALHFAVEDVRVSVDALIINYRNHFGHAVAEVLRFRDSLIWWGCAAYESN